MTIPRAIEVKLREVSLDILFSDILFLACNLLGYLLIFYVCAYSGASVNLETQKW